MDTVSLGLGQTEQGGPELGLKALGARLRILPSRVGDMQCQQGGLCGDCRPDTLQSLFTRTQQESAWPPWTV